MRFFGGFLTYNRIRIDWAKHLLRQVLVSYMTKFPLNWVWSWYIWGKESQLCLAIGRNAVCFDGYCWYKYVYGKHCIMYRLWSHSKHAYLDNSTVALLRRDLLSFAFVDWTFARYSTKYSILNWKTRDVVSHYHIVYHKQGPSPQSDQSDLSLRKMGNDGSQLPSLHRLDDWY